MFYLSITTNYNVEKSMFIEIYYSHKGSILSVEINIDNIDFNLRKFEFELLL